ncbi:MAG TPA: ImmA/IrrE family metallo-endopeptidase [Syntrophothermus lipocalidus]|uniref:HTH cro/C1-type domain-containing protein n=1 Tax=Syntrophothermus lipocalidus (strain DSM 12680 / TGB-C1) TaxID=643648 RepID=D7CPB5_SYNLT|nr:ImmA/IrrE family metallo-endopeptidase [Syntrophothermus lipocalidus]ADI02550.1 protein of unknown function DUF955 [Syntrophothermus lipocalidus DSM 12680]HHV76434.1 ImmA/IrrE family metallo-endopeptidase [Syntrophothermus lipocalidus]
MNPWVNGERVKQARELIGLSQTEFARRLNITQPAVALIEAGRFTPSEELLNQIAFQTGFPVSFFFKEIRIDFPMGSLLFRSKMQASVKEKTKVYRSAQLIYELTDTFLARVRGLPVRISKLDVDPAEAARLTRSALGLSPDRPIPRLIYTLENAGVVIISLPVYSNSIDAFSCWVGTGTVRPVIALTEGWPGDRQRFSLAHELGHLVLHGSYHGTGIDVEQEANDFAAEFLVPEQAIREELTTPVRLKDLLEVKKRWGVSVQFLVLRAYRLGLITQRQYKYLYQQIGAKGWRQKEPIDIPVEKPRLLRQLVETTYGVPMNFKQVASDTQLPSRFVENTLLGYLGKDPAHPITSESGKIVAFPGRDKSTGAN